MHCPTIEDSAFGETGLVFGKELERLGVPPLTIERLKRGDIDIKPQLTKIKSLGATHIQFWGYYAEFAIAARQMRELGFDATLMGNQAPVNDKTIELGGEAVGRTTGSPGESLFERLSAGQATQNRCGISAC